MKTDQLINRLSQEAENLPEVIAPVLYKDGKIRVIINQLPYWFKVYTEKAGWYILRPLSSIQAEIAREAQPFEILKCLDHVPSLRVISMRRLAANSWLVFPFNLSDAQSRGLEAKPQECHLIDQNIEPFMVLTTRLWGGSLLLDHVIAAAPPELKAAIEKQSKVPPKISGLIPEFKIVYGSLVAEIDRAKLATVEGRIRSAVEYLGAELVSFIESGEGFTVSWRDGQQTYNTRVDRNLRMISTGICLSHMEQEQTLVSAVAVMRRYERRSNDDYDD